MMHVNTLIHLRYSNYKNTYTYCVPYPVNTRLIKTTEYLDRVTCVRCMRNYKLMVEDAFSNDTLVKD